MAKKKPMTPTQRAYKQQIRRVEKYINKLKEQGLPTRKLTKEFKEAITTRPTKKSIEKLKRDYSARQLINKAGAIRTKQGIITKEQYHKQLKQKKKEQEAHRKLTRRELAQRAKEQYVKHQIEQHRKAEQTASQFMSQPPKLSDKIFERVHQMISDTRSNGSVMLEKELSRQIKKYGRTAVEKSFEALPSHYIEQMETLIKYGDDSKQNSLTIKHIAEAIKSEILSDAERMEIANTTDSEEDYGE